MKLLALLTCLFTLASSAFAAAAACPPRNHVPDRPPYDSDQTHGDGNKCRKACLTEDQTPLIIARWFKMFVAMNADLAARSTTKHITLFDDQVNFLSGPVSPSKPDKPLFPPGTPYITNQKDFVAQQKQTQMTLPTFDNLFTPLFYMFGCNNIVIRWQFTGKSFAFPGSTNKMGAFVQYKGFDFLNIQSNSFLIENATTSYDSLDQFFAYGIRLCFQKDNATACD